jgi:hypothetical protein
MKDNLQDLISHIHGLGAIDVIKIVGTDTQTNFAAVSQDKNGKIIIEGQFKNPDSEFIGTFGMPNLDKLKTILGFDEYDENAKIFTKRDGDVPKVIHFESKTGDFVNDYRLMAESIVKEKVSTIIFKGAAWNIEFNPTVEGIGRLKKQAQANSDQENFKIKVENNDFKIYFGDPATHSGNFVFYPQVSGTIGGTLEFPVNLVIQVLSMAGDKTMRIAERGLLEITIDSGIAVYRYLIPAQTK